MVEKSDWEEFFDGHAPVYMDNAFTTNTVAEVDFILDELKLPVGSYILDMGCGTGRHDVELAKRGYKVTGVDLSAGMLAEARKAAGKAGVKIEFLQSDATLFESEERFDAALCLCEGAFCLLGVGDEPIERDLKILRNINGALKPGARMIMTTLNACKMIRQYTPEDVEKGLFDPLTLCETHPMECDTPDGKKEVTVIERGYLPTELRMLYNLAGFEVENIWGGTAGNWGRRKLELDEYEIMVVAVKRPV